MDKSKIKNFILILLALVNIFLLAIVLSSAREEQEAEASRKKALNSVISEYGITLNPEIVIEDTIPPLLTLQRDMDTEHDQISALIGKCTPEDQGGNSFFYNGVNGLATFRGTGDFKIMLNSGVISRGRDPVGAAKMALKRMNLECSDIEPVVTHSGDNTTVTLCCSWNGTAIHNAKIELTFNSDYLWVIEGVRPLDSKNSVQSSVNYPDSITILMNFLESKNQNSYIFSEINDLKIEYSMNSAISGNCTLKPVWCVVTNSGSYRIDAKTGEAENKDISS